MQKKLFPTPEDAEAAFYDALERANLSAMMAVWAIDDQTVCIHPYGPRFAGFEAIRTSWVDIFSHGPGPKFRVSELRKHQSPTLAIHSLYESLILPSEARNIAPVLATNVYLLTPAGWRMVIRHACSSPDGTTAEEQGTARILH